MNQLTFWKTCSYGLTADTPIISKSKLILMNACENDEIWSRQ